MPNRQYFCWKMCLKFHCGCVEYTSTQHVCNANRGVVCNKWMITRSTDKDCDAHRIVGLHGGSSSSSPPSWDEGEWMQETMSEDVYNEQQQQLAAGAAQRRVPSEGGCSPNSGSYEQGPQRRTAN